MGLKTNFEFFNQLRIGDLRTVLTQGDPTIIDSIPANAPGTVAQFRELLALTPPVDILKLFVPHKATAIVQILNGIESLADFNQRLGRHMASQPALEPIQAVLCDMLRSGSDFDTDAKLNPLGIATQAVRHVCSTPDDDATVFKPRVSRKTAQASTATAAGTGLEYCCVVIGHRADMPHRLCGDAEWVALGVCVEVGSRAQHVT